MKAPSGPIRYQHIALASLLLLISSLVGVAVCQSRTGQPSKVLAPQHPLSAGEEFGVTNTSLYSYAGTMDVENRYVSTVMITTDPQTRVVRCSGVLISPRVVLTAASCLCGAACIERAFVTTVSYGAALDKEFPEDTTPMRFASYAGAVRPHPQFKPSRDDAGPARPGHADLAVIVLADAVKGVPPETMMEPGEIQARDSLIMAGYAHDRDSQVVGGLYGVRYFRKNIVTQVLTPDDGRVLYQQQGPFIYNGYAGGPCFRESSQQHLLVGIATIGSDRELPLTSISPFLEWLRAEVQHAEAQPPPAPNH